MQEDPGVEFGATIRSFGSGQRVFGRFVLESMLGRGGMGVVWLAKDESLGVDVALKFLPEMVGLDEAAVADLARETRRARELAHPHIVRVYDFHQDDQLAGISMEWIDGATLTRLRLQQPNEVFQTEKLRPWVGQLAEALDYAHVRSRVVHRDLKPSNLMVDERSGDLKVADFGVSASVSESVTRVSKVASSSGSPPYMSPQQMMGKPPSPSDDIYAVGATLYELLTGKAPFYTGNIILQVQSIEPPSITERRTELGVPDGNVPQPWEEAIAACLAKQPDQRPASLKKLVEWLDGDAADSEARTVVSVMVPQMGPSGRAGSESDRSPAKADPLPAETGKDGDPSPSAPVTPAVTGPRASDVETPSRRAGTARPTGTGTEPTGERSRRSQGPLFIGIVAAVALIAGAAWYFGSYRPEQKQLQQQQASSGAGSVEEQAPGSEQEVAAESAQQVEQSRATARGGIIVESDPPGADVTVGGFAREKSPATLKDVNLGTYAVNMTLTGYDSWTGEVEVQENQFTTIRAELVRSTGSVQVNSIPSGLEFELTGQGRTERGTTPRLLEKLPTGDYSITVRRGDWPDQRIRATVERGTTAPLLAEFAEGSVAFASTPPGALVEISGNGLNRTSLKTSDGRESLTPFTGQLRPGEYEVTFSLAGHRSETRKVTVKAKQTERLSASLSEQRGPQSGSPYVVPDLGLELVWIEPGTFSMGSPSGEVARDNDEGPRTRVTLSRGFWLGKYEVTQGEWQALMGNNPSEFKNAGSRAPVEQVSWDGAVEFCRKLTEREQAAGRLPAGYAFALPSEAQWEFACRAGTSGPYGGTGTLGEMGWFDQNSGDTTHPVGQKRENAWGLYDMHGNVWEWTSGWHADSYPGGSVTDYAGPTSGSVRVNRGGSWSGYERHCRSANRNRNNPGNRDSNLGFRVACVQSSDR